MQQLMNPIDHRAMKREMIEAIQPYVNEQVKLYQHSSKIRMLQEKGDGDFFKLTVESYLPPQAQKICDQIEEVKAHIVQLVKNKYYTG